MSTPTVERPILPSAADIVAVRDLASRVAAEDGRGPLSDQALSRLTSRLVTHVLVRDAERVSGYGQLDGDAGELTAERSRIDMTLDALLSTARGLDAFVAVRVWSHGRDSRLSPAMQRRHAAADRRLYQLRRPLSDPIADRPVPAGVTISSFTVGRDEDQWLRVNARAFATHPEQGSWTLPDLTARERESWFDPAGFLLARRDDRVVGFHWTKIHPDGLGEVYVIGVDPSEQGTGLGAVLLNRGLGYLQGRGCPTVLLYVDESNQRAMQLYERSGFTRYDVDIQWTLALGE